MCDLIITITITQVLEGVDGGKTGALLVLNKDLAEFFENDI